MDNPETVAIDSVSDTVTTEVNLLYKQQEQDVKGMRSALLGCNRKDAKSVKSAMRNILVMRVYHQLARIIRFTEEMDKIEDKMYKELDRQLLDPDFTGTESLVLLIGIQERLQKVMVDSQKLLDPYLDMNELMMIEAEVEEEQDDSFGSKILSQTSRQNIREGARRILSILDSPTSSESGKVG